MQGSSFTFLPPLFAILSLPHNLCPAGPSSITADNSSMPIYNDTDGTIVTGDELWKKRMREVLICCCLYV